MRVFVSFDERYDQDLYALLVEQSRRAGSTFEVVHDGSAAMQSKGWSNHPRASIRAADEVVVLCGEHTHDSLRVALELEITREENKPYLLVWGRRECMCTRPDTAFSGDGMYSWTRDVLESQMGIALRSATPRVIPESYKRRPEPRKTSATPATAGRKSERDEASPPDVGDS